MGGARLRRSSDFLCGERVLRGRVEALDEWALAEEDSVVYLEKVVLVAEHPVRSACTITSPCSHLEAKPLPQVYRSDKFDDRAS